MDDLPRKLQKTVRILAAFLRIAETLDRSQHGVVRRIEVRERAGTLRLDVFAVGDSELEVWAATRQLAALESALETARQNRRASRGRIRRGGQARDRERLAPRDSYTRIDSAETDVYSGPA